jgi:peptidoglycan/xylan/chitin deacetylase (PgdA/CDA1 family)
MLYHSISSRPSALIEPFSTRPDVFGEHLDCIRELGFSSLTISDLVARIQGRSALPERPIVITFDDGFADFADVAAPALHERGLVSTIYLTTGFLRGRAGHPPVRGFDDPMLAWSQLTELPAQGVEVGAHSHTHPHLDTVRRRRAWDEITRSKALLEDALHTEIRSFAYPNGYSSPMVRSLVRQAAFSSACSVKDALSCTEDDLFAIPRLMVRAETSTPELRSWLTGARRVAKDGERLRTRLWRLHRRARALATGRPGSDIR